MKTFAKMVVLSVAAGLTLGLAAGANAADTPTTGLADNPVVICQHENGEQHWTLLLKKQTDVKMRFTLSPLNTNRAVFEGSCISIYCTGSQVTPFGEPMSVKMSIDRLSGKATFRDEGAKSHAICAVEESRS